MQVFMFIPKTVIKTLFIISMIVLSINANATLKNDNNISGNTIVNNIKKEFLQNLKKRVFTKSYFQKLLPKKSFLQKYAKKYKNLTIVPKYAKDFIKNFKKENKQKKFEKEFAKFVVYLAKNNNHFTKKQIQDFKKQLEKALFPKKYPMILYLFSMSVPKSTVRNVFIQLRKLKKIFPHIQYAGVLRGLDLKNFGMKLHKYADFLKRDEQIKIHPLIFEKLNVSEVPVFVYAKCPKIFRYKQCDYKYMAYGDFSLEYFLELIGDANNNLKIYYYKFKEGQK